MRLCGQCLCGRVAQGMGYLTTLAPKKTSPLPSTSQRRGCLDWAAPQWTGLVATAGQEARQLHEEVVRKRAEVEELVALGQEEPGLAQGAAQDVEDLEANITRLTRRLEDVMLLGRGGAEVSSPAVHLEVTPGAGGEEAKLFAADIFAMYIAWATRHGWELEIRRHATSEMEGLRRAEARVVGPNAYRLLQYEGGIHRVQRVPATEKGGRTHTSTVSVVVLPEPPKVEVVLAKKDLKVEVTTSSGPGGQHVNKTQSAVRITHIPTNTTVYSEETRNQDENREKALSAVLYDRQLAESSARFGASRKLQTGSKNRSEKIRTYNYIERRVTDHRIKQTFHSLQQILDGGEALDELVNALLQFARTETLTELRDDFMRSQ